MGPIKHNRIHVYPQFKTAFKLSRVVTIGWKNLTSAVKIAAGLVTGRHIWDTKGFMNDLKEAVRYSFGLLTYIMAPHVSNHEEQRLNSKYLGTIGTTTAAGTRIPFGYGLYKLSGHIISYNVSTTKLKVIDRGILNESKSLSSRTFKG